MITKDSNYIIGNIQFSIKNYYMCKEMEKYGHLQRKKQLIQTVPDIGLSR